MEKKYIEEFDKNMEMAPITLLPLPSKRDRDGGWRIDAKFILAVLDATKNIIAGFDQHPSMEQVEAVLLAANVQFLRSWRTAGGGVDTDSGVELTDNELSALIEACNVANRHRPRPPWNSDGRSAWNKLTSEEMRRGQEKKRR